MNFNNVIYLIDNKIYYKNNNNIIEFCFKKDIIYELKKEQFINNYLSFLRKNKLKTIIFYQTITIIYDSILSKHDCNYLKNIFYEIGYRKVFLKKDISFINASKENAYLITGKQYKLIYRDNYNQKKEFILNKEILSIKELTIIIKNRVKNNLIIIGNYDSELLIDNYYIIDHKSIFFLEN